MKREEHRTKQSLSV